MSAAATLNVKKEPVDLMDIQDQLLKVVESHPNSITTQEIFDKLTSFSSQNVIDGLNALLKKNKLQVRKKANDELVYVLNTTSVVNNLKGADSEEKLVLQIIEEAGNKGIWNKIVHEKSKITIKQLDKILKNLEAKKLIKRVSSVAAARKKIYMLYDLVPDISLTGGSWYSEQRFDSEYVDLINACCLRILQQKVESCEASKNLLDPMAYHNSTFMSSSEILKVLTESNVSKITLSLNDIETLLETLVFDGKVQKRVVSSSGANSSSSSSQQPQQVTLYRTIPPIIQPTGLMRVPCGHCPVMNDCEVGGVISPETCVYMDEWLNF
ncbi:hypothetical protein HELRODRAFT_184881 [Helobdella robusta]|uniref:DNA-directed RNA polymerase III subunit RPC6 n=1 Tax=Helobdella robusta TaxID=6412 RepID=T1FM46_HELRO|nr:hypothetical protein HELRODRAFT_184881 [Helobdella robusta]ESO13213.1 hypothetical protein HELRODRAFT_184881 [Helobdella robusta]